MRFLVEACRVGCYSAFLCFLVFWNFVMELGIQGSSGVGGTLISDQQQVCWVYSYVFSKFSFFLRFNQNRICPETEPQKELCNPPGFTVGVGDDWMSFKRSPDRIIDDISALDIRNLISPQNVWFSICNRNAGCRFFCVKWFVWTFGTESCILIFGCRRPESWRSEWLNHGNLSLMPWHTLTSPAAIWIWWMKWVANHGCLSLPWLAVIFTRLHLELVKWVGNHGNIVTAITTHWCCCDEEGGDLTLCERSPIRLCLHSLSCYPSKESLWRFLCDLIHICCTDDHSVYTLRHKEWLRSCVEGLGFRQRAVII